MYSKWQFILILSFVFGCSKLEISMFKKKNNAINGKLMEWNEKKRKEWRVVLSIIILDRLWFVAFLICRHSYFSSLSSPVFSFSLCLFSLFTIYKQTNTIRWTKQNAAFRDITYMKLRPFYKCMYSAFSTHSIQFHSYNHIYTYLHRCIDKCWWSAFNVFTWPPLVFAFSFGYRLLIRSIWINRLGPDLYP